jgi:hypothetical protein
MHMGSNSPSALLWPLWALVLTWPFQVSLGAGQVIINEVVAAASERLLSWDEAGRPWLGTGPGWQTLGFSASEWRTGVGPFGFGYPNPGTDLRAAIYARTPSLYLRCEFEVSAAIATSTNGLRFRIAYDDGFVAYLNGVEIARRNLGPSGMFVYANQPVFNPVTNLVEEVIELGPGLLVPGTNLLAVQVHSQWPPYTLFSWPIPFDETLWCHATLECTGVPATVLVGPDHPWRYHVGVVEPSGGLYDPDLADADPAQLNFSDWVELHNLGTESVALAGWSLTDDPNNPRKWVFPEVTLPAGGYLVLLCSGLDRRDPSGRYLHTNFDLDKDGEYLGLYDAAGEVVSEFARRFPRIPPFYSWGRDPVTGAYGYFRQPTPGQANRGSLLVGLAEPPEFSPAPGKYDRDLVVTLSCVTPGVTIRYTTDGTEPTVSNGIEYTGPLLLTSNVALRARAFRPGWVPSSVVTATYLVRAPAPLVSLPVVSLTADPRRALYAPQGVLTIHGGSYPGGEVWVASSPDDYNMALMHGSAFERPVSMELFADHLDSGYVQIDCGLRFASGRFSRPRFRFFNLENDIWYAGWVNKPSFALFFRGDYGASSLDAPVFPNSPLASFDSLRLRAGKNDWLNPFIRDEVVRRLSLDMGQLSSHGLLCNLFVNGAFKAHFNLVERYREPFFQAYYQSTNGWDIIMVDEIEAGDAVKWTEDVTFVAGHSMADPAWYAEAQARFDLVNFVDYLLLNIYCATWDWPQGNFYVARERAPGARWRFYVWDAEGSFGIYVGRDVDYNAITNDLMRARPPYSWVYQVIPILYRAMVTNSDFRLLFADRVQKHLFNGGALTASNVLARYQALKDQLDPTLVHVTGTPVFADYITNWALQRPTYLLQHLREAGLWPTVAAPVFSHSGGQVAPGLTLVISNPNPDGRGSIYYTLDGADPRAPGGQPVGTLFTGPISITRTTVVKARIWDGQEWSPLAEASFVVAAPVGLVISEIAYEPTPFQGIDGGLFEFVEIQNTSSNLVHLTDVGFTEGVRFTFPPGMTLGPGQFAVVVANPTWFASRYPGVPIAGQFTGKLDNGGERLTLAYLETNVLFSVRYDNAFPWPVAAAGGGCTLVPADSGVTDPDDFRYWRASSRPDGSPGAVDPPLSIVPVVINEVVPRADPTGGWVIELHNPNDIPADVGGWWLTDDAATPGKYRFPTPTVLPPGTFLTLSPQTFMAVPPAQRVKLQPEGGQLVLYSADAAGNLTGYASVLRYSGSALGLAFGRHTNSVQEVQFPALSSATPGAPNSAPRVGPVVINEIMYRSRAGGAEYIELYNADNNPVLLFDPTQPELTWRLDGVDYELPPETVLGPGEFLVLVNMDPEFFRRQYDVPPEVRILGPWKGALQDDGERLRLQQPERLPNGQVVYVTVDEVRYSPKLPWPTGAAGTGRSLQRISPELYSNDPQHWAVAVPTPGRANFSSSEIVIAAPAGGSLALEGTPVTISATVNSLLGEIGRVEFYSGITRLGEDVSPPYDFYWIASPPGTHGLRAVAVTSYGLVYTSAVVQMQVLPRSDGLEILVSSNSVWKYLDWGVDLGAAWRVLSFDDSAWPAGPAELGYGDAAEGRPEATVIGYGPDPSNKYITTYFRHSFVTDPAAFAGDGRLRLLVDDGAVVYLNGQKVLRYNLPAGEIDYRTWALSDSPEDYWITQTVPRSLFVAGTNLLAVEVHQSSPQSDDVSFALELAVPKPVIGPWIARQPRGQVVEVGQDVTLDVEAAGANLVYQWYRVSAGPVPGATAPRLTLSSVLPETAGDYYVVVTNSLGAVTSRLATVIVLVPYLQGQVVISEIMYHPASKRADEEYIELHNRRDQPVNLAGWRLTKGVHFTFPPVTIPASGYLAVAADVAAFRAKYPDVTNVVGGWEGTLRNSDEVIELQDSLGREVDSLHYADSGDWAIRRRGPVDFGTRGWEWFAPHDGLGPSLELIQTDLPNNSGQNWAASLAAEGTPGRPNSVAATNLAPMILDVVHLPVLPTPTDAVTIAARIVDESATGLTVTLYYRNHSSTSPPPFTAVAMRDDGQGGDGQASDGIYSAVIPPQTNGTVIEFYIAARDSQGLSRTWPAPALDEYGLPVQAANALYQVGNASYTGSQPVVYLIMTETERRTLETIDRSSNAEMNGTLVTTDAVETSVRYNVGIRIRGASTRGMPVPSLRVNIPSDRRWKNVTAINLNSYFPHCQIIGSVMSFKAGLTVANARAVQLRVNGMNPAKPGPPNLSDGSGFGTYALLEVVDPDWAQAHFPNDPEGNIYLARRPNTDLSYRGTNWLDYARAGYIKNSNQDENDWSDLIHLTDVLNNTPDAAYVEQVRHVLDAAEWALYFAVNTVLGNNESSLATGVGDDYDMYRGIEDPRFLLIPHDWDTILGQAGGLPPDADIFLAAGLPAVARFLKHPEFVPLYYRELKRLIDTICSPEQFHPLLDQFLGGFVDSGTLASMKHYVTARAAYLRSRIPLSLTVTSSLPVVNGLSRTTVPVVALWGQANAIDTRRVLVNGQLATWSAWDARWTNTSVSLLPGMNRILVQALDAAGAIADEATMTIWYDAGTQTTVPGGTLSGDVSWAAANGPYYLVDHLVIPAGASLTIAPGTTVYAAPGVLIRVNGLLRAVGTATQPIHFMLRPGTTGFWAGFDLFDTTNENCVAYAILDQTTAYPIDVRNSKLTLDHVVFRGVYGAIYTTNSTLYVRSCQFPTMLGAETVVGYGVPTNGYVIFEGNTFGGTSGYADIIDFTGGKRPYPIIQVYSNVFLGGSDDGLDLDFTDAHVEGNWFMHFHRDAPRESISCGIATDESAEIVAVRNVFYDCDNAVLLKRNAWLTAQNNTFVKCLETVIDFGSTNRAVLPGRGALFEGNISWDNRSTFERYAEPGYSAVDLTVCYSLIEGTNWPGVGNLSADPLFRNPSNDFRLRPGSPALGTGPNGLDMGAYVPAGASISGEPPAVTPQTWAVLTVAGPGITHYRYQINDGPFSAAEYPVSQPLVLTNLTNGTYCVGVIGKNSAAVWQPTNAPTRTKTWTVDTTLRRLWINEVLARNEGALNHYGTFPDFIELYNAGASPFDLSGLQLSDDPNVPNKFVFPAGVILQPGEFLVLFADDPNGTPGWHLGFSLRREGEMVCLHDSVTNGGALLDSVVFGLQLPNWSIGRQRDGTWTLTHPTPGAPNRPACLGDPAQLRFSEWLACGPDDDFVELYNPSPAPVPLGGLYLTDNPTGWPTRHRVADLSFAPPRGYVVFRADGNVAAGADHLNFKLAYEQGLLGLFDPELRRIDFVAYGPQRPGVSTGRLTPEGEQIVEFVRPSPGLPNTLNAPPTVQLVSPTQGQVIPDPGDLVLWAVASDSDGQVIRVEFYGDDAFLGEVTAPPYSLVWPRVSVGAHTVLVKAIDEMGAVGVSEVIRFSVGQPDVVLEAPLGGQVVPTGRIITLRAMVTGATSSVVRVEFYARGAKVGEDSEAPYECSWTTASPGPAQLQAVAITLDNRPVASPVVEIRWLNAQISETVVLVASNAVWKYWDTNAEPPGPWTAPDYDDTAWPAGPAELGYGDGGEATVINYGPDPNNKYPTAYFRHQFVISDLASWQDVTLRLLVDDGTVIYLNNQRVLVFNMPTGSITFNTYASTAFEGNSWLSYPLAEGYLIEGTNQLAAEVHQVQPASSDLSFALELTGSRFTIEPWILTPPAHQTVEVGSEAVLGVEAAGSPRHYQWYRTDGSQIPGAVGAVLRLPAVQPEDAGGYYVVVSNALGCVTSAVAILTVETPDRDRDGVPDYWENQHGMNPADPQDALADWDGDLMVNRHEYELRTDPWTPDLFIQTQRMLGSSGTSGLQLRFRATAAGSYAVEQTDHLTAGSWGTVTNLSAVGPGALLEVNLPVTGTQRFYRIRQHHSEP